MNTTARPTFPILHPIALALVVSAALLAPASAVAGKLRCPADTAAIGNVCVDLYEASVWRLSDPGGADAGLVKKIRAGKSTLADLTAAGAVRVGNPSNDFAPCDAKGEGCSDLFAVSLPEQKPTRWASWFQAQQACANSGKRLPTNAEWQLAASGTPDGVDDGVTSCNVVDASAVVTTGSRSACVSARGHYDMSGNLREWVADWVASASACPGWGAFSNDRMCLSGASVIDEGPAALLRGGGFFDENDAGPFYIDATSLPYYTFHANGFRCAR